MSFGRDPSKLDRGGSFRQVGEGIASRPRRKSNNEGGLWWLRLRDRFLPSLIQPDTVRLLRADYTVPYIQLDEENEPIAFDDKGVPVIELAEHQSFWRARKHWSTRVEETVYCSGGALVDYKYGKFREQCVACDGRDADYRRNKAEGVKREPSISISDEFVVNVLHYATYHEMPQVDRGGQVRMNPNTNKPYTEWVTCQRPYSMPCNGCKTGASSVPARVLHWPMPWGHYMTLLAQQDQIGRNCLTCGGVNCIETRAWLCRNKGNCGNAVIDLSETELAIEDIKKMTRKCTTCHYCGFRGFLEEYMECNNCTPAGRDPARATLFDVDMNVRRQENAARNDGKKAGTTLQISQWSEARPIPADYAELAKKILPLDKMYCPTPLDQQAKQLKLPMPSMGGGGGVPPVVRTPMTGDEAARPYVAPGVPTPSNPLDDIPY